MIQYNPDLENFVDGVDVDYSKPCVWVVYPPGCGGDLLASIINFHYVETGARFRGINNQGQTIFRPSDQKYINQLKKKNQFVLDDKFFFDIADILASINLNWSKMDCLLFSNHCYTEYFLEKILSKFTNCKIVRLLPKTHNEQVFVNWLEQFKNCNNKITEINLIENDYPLDWDECKDPRVLTIYFGDFISVNKFDQTYQSVITHLDLPGLIVRYDFIQYWINQQDIHIQEYVKRLANN